MTTLAGFTERDIPRQDDKVFAITGANAGLGFLAAKALAKAGAEVCMLCRDPDKAAAATQELLESVPGGCFSHVAIDVGDLASVEAANETIRKRYDGLDGLINNAGVGPGARALTVDGFEKRFGVNYVGAFVLSALLSDLVERRAGRFVTLTSMAYLVSGGIPFDDLEQTRGYGSTRAYGVSKLADLMFGVELQRRLSAAGRRATSYVCQPGMVATNLFTQAEGFLLRAFARPMQALIGQSPEQGVLPTLLCATAPIVEPGGFYGPTGPRGLKGPTGSITPEPWAVDPSDASRLWSVTLDRTGVDWKVFEA
jgi:NAD(P)-dependent dehydrogenase (short-subunit alcohol dehydrogenase family)